MRSLFLLALAIILALLASNIVWAQVSPSPQSDLVSPTGDLPVVEENPGGNVEGGSTPEVSEEEKGNIDGRKEKGVQGGSYDQKSVWNYQKTYAPPDFGRDSHPSPSIRPPSVVKTPSQKPATIGHKKVQQKVKSWNPASCSRVDARDKALTRQINKETAERKAEDEKIKTSKNFPIVVFFLIAFAGVIILAITGILAVGLANRE